MEHRVLLECGRAREIAHDGAMKLGTVIAGGTFDIVDQGVGRPAPAEQAGDESVEVGPTYLIQVGFEGCRAVRVSRWQMENVKGGLLCGLFTDQKARVLQLPVRQEPPPSRVPTGNNPGA